MTRSRASRPPKLGTGRPQYSQSRNRRTFSRATRSRYSTSRGQRRHSMISSWDGNLSILDEHADAAEIKCFATACDDRSGWMSQLRQDLRSRCADPRVYNRVTGSHLGSRVLNKDRTRPNDLPRKHHLARDKPSRYSLQHAGERVLYKDLGRLRKSAAHIARCGRHKWVRLKGKEPRWGYVEAAGRGLCKAGDDGWRTHGGRDSNPKSGVLRRQRCRAKHNQRDTGQDGHTRLSDFHMHLSNY